MTARTRDGPTDMTVDRTGRILYALNAAEGSISAFEVGRHGDLEPIGIASGLPAGAITGLAAR